jgi:hypothetical protein
VFARFSVDSKQGIFTKPIKLTSAEVPCFESTEDRAQHCFKNEWTLVKLLKDMEQISYNVIETQNTTVY